MNPSEKILRLKQIKFREAVYNVCTVRRMPRPEINFALCDQEDQYHIAHYHPGEHKICISPRQLSALNYDEIKDTVSHELAHYKFGDHDSAFKDEETSNSIAGFMPGPGVITVSNNPESDVTSARKRNRPIDASRCFYHMCGKKVDLHKCNYCEHRFCMLHELPKPVRISPLSEKDRIGLFEELQASKLPTHPCSGYSEYVNTVSAEETKIFGSLVDEYRQRRASKSVEKRIREAVRQVISNEHSLQRTEASAEPAGELSDHSPRYQSIAQWELASKKKRFRLVAILVFLLAGIIFFALLARSGILAGFLGLP
jgi:hypothetical protein